MLAAGPFIEIRIVYLVAAYLAGIGHAIDVADGVSEQRLATALHDAMYERCKQKLLAGLLDGVGKGLQEIILSTFLRGLAEQMVY